MNDIRVTCVYLITVVSHFNGYFCESFLQFIMYLHNGSYHKSLFDPGHFLELLPIRRWNPRIYNPLVRKIGQKGSNRRASCHNYPEQVYYNDCMYLLKLISIREDFSGQVQLVIRVSLRVIQTFFVSQILRRDVKEWLEERFRSWLVSFCYLL